MIVIQFKSQFGIVVVADFRNSRVPQGRESTHAVQIRKLFVVSVPGRIERTKKEEVILKVRNVSAKLSRDVPFTLVNSCALLVQSAGVIRIQMLNFKLLRSDEGAKPAVKLIAA